MYDTVIYRDQKEVTKFRSKTLNNAVARVRKMPGQEADMARVLLRASDKVLTWSFKFRGKLGWVPDRTTIEIKP